MQAVEHFQACPLAQAREPDYSTTDIEGLSSSTPVFESGACQPAVFDPGTLVRLAHGGTAPVSPSHACADGALAESRTRSSRREVIVAGDILSHRLVSVPSCRRACGTQTPASHWSLMAGGPADQT